MQTFVIVNTWIVWGRTNSCQRSVCQSWLLSWWFLLNPSLLLILISLGYQSACFGCVLFAHTLLGRLVKDRHVRGIRIGDEIIDRSYHFVLSVVYRKSQSQHAMFILSVRTGGTPPMLVHCTKNGLERKYRMYFWNPNVCYMYFTLVV